VAEDGSATLAAAHTILEIYRVSDMSLARVLPSAQDEVNAAAFHPFPVRARVGYPTHTSAAHGCAPSAHRSVAVDARCPGAPRHARTPAVCSVRARSDLGLPGCGRPCLARPARRSRAAASCAGRAGAAVAAGRAATGGGCGEQGLGCIPYGTAATGGGGGAQGGGIVYGTKEGRLRILRHEADAPAAPESEADRGAAWRSLVDELDAADRGAYLSEDEPAGEPPAR